MRRRHRWRDKSVFVSIVFFSSITAASPVRADETAPLAPVPEVASNRLVITTKDGVDTSAQRAIAAGESAHVVRQIDNDTFALTVSATERDRITHELESSPAVVSVRRDNIFHSARTPNDPCYTSCTLNGIGGSVTTSQWQYAKVNAPAAWDQTLGSSSIRVALLDTGVSQTHPELSGKVDYGTTFATGAGSANDSSGHGSHAAGLITAITDNATAISSLGWNTRVLSVKVLDDAGNGYGSDIAAGIRYAADQGTPIISMSLGGGDDGAVSSAVSYAQSKGVLIVAAAGNGTPGGNLTAPQYPAAYRDVISVAASDQNDNLADFSYRGSWVKIAAPGVGILSTYKNTSYAILDGTSMATPQVAAAAALVLAAHPGISASEISARLHQSADHTSGTGSSVQWGRLNVGNAISASVSGYWLSASDGGIFSFGSKAFYGSTGGVHLNQPIVGMAATKSGRGYWLVASDGGIFAYGDAPFYGSTGSMHLNKPIVGMASNGTGNGYWLVASDGGIFAYGDAPFYGSTGSMHLNQPIVGMESVESGAGYWMVASDGGMFAYGSAPFYGSASGSDTSIVAMHRTITGAGYWLTSSNGLVFPYGDAINYGDLQGVHLVLPVVGITN